MADCSSAIYPQPLEHSAAISLARDCAVDCAIRARRCTASRRSTRAFFPPATRPQFMVDVFLPAGTHIRETEAFAETVEKYIQAQPGVTHVTSFIGGGGLRFLLVYSPEKENRAFVQFLVDVDDPSKIDGADRRHPKTLGRTEPERQRRGQEISARARRRADASKRVSSGPDPAVLRQLADQATKILEDDGGAVCVRERLARARKSHPPRFARTAGAPQRHHARRSGPGSGNQLRRPRRRLLPRAGQRRLGHLSPGNAAAADRRAPAARRARGCPRSSTACRSGARSPGG